MFDEFWRRLPQNPSTRCRVITNYYMSMSNGVSLEDKERCAKGVPS